MSSKKRSKRIVVLPKQRDAVAVVAVAVAVVAVAVTVEIVSR